MPQLFTSWVLRVKPFQLHKGVEGVSRKNGPEEWECVRDEPTQEQV